MNDKLMIVLIVLVVLYAHWFLYHWIKFKVDEAVILKYLDSTTEINDMDIKSIATAVKLNEKRILKICKNSKDSKLNKIFSVNHLSLKS